jgi:ketosteroid isomerase-like protein
MIQTELVDHTDDTVLAAGPSGISVQEARDLVKLFAEVTTSKNVDDFLSGFTEDCVVHYGEFPVMRGKAEFRPFVEQMFSDRLQSFVCRKSLRTLNGNVIGGTWIAEWTDARTGKRKQGRGFEFWIMRGRQIARWDAAFNAWDVS